MLLHAQFGTNFAQKTVRPQDDLSVVGNLFASYVN